MDRSRFTPKEPRTRAHLWSSIWRHLATVAALALCAAGCAGDSSASPEADRGGAANASGASGEGNGRGSGIGDNTAIGGSGGGAVSVDCPPGIPIVAQGVGGGTSPGTACSDGTGTAKLGERCLSNANCAPGTFCFSGQCTAICGDSLRKLGQYTSMAPCQDLFGFAVCVVATKATGVQATIPDSVFFCAPTCAKDADCSVGATCTQGEYYKSLPTNPPSYEWYDLVLVCTVD